MYQFSSYEVIIFDCDGVILDSNNLKVDAMRNALESLSDDRKAIEKSVDYFRNNFGKSRFYHVDVFVSDFFRIKGKLEFKQKVISSYSEHCKSLYLEAFLTPGIIEFLNLILKKKKKLYVASGSEESELREVFYTRKLDSYFKSIFGSPTSKSENILNILKTEETNKAVMIGDSVSDFEAAMSNKIDFICYLPYSNVKSKMKQLSRENDFLIVESFEELINV